MTPQPRESVLLKCAEIFPTDYPNKNLTAALKDHVQIPMLLDILTRREHHHVVLTEAISGKINHALMHALSQYLATDQVSKSLREAYFIYFDFHRFALTEETVSQIAADFSPLTKELTHSGKQIIFVLNAIDDLFSNQTNTAVQFLSEWIKQHIFRAEWRFILFTHEKKDTLPIAIKKHFIVSALQNPTETELLTLLTTQREKLEHFHHVIIPDDILVNALLLANHYFAPKHPLDQAMEILDSAAAKTSLHERFDQAGQPAKPVINPTILATTIANWTQIPSHLLFPQKFKAIKFFQNMQQRICGQDIAINLISTVLQQASLNLLKKSGTLANFLFAGPHEVGKTETVYALCEQLHGTTQALLTIILPDTAIHHIEDIEVTTSQGQMPLLVAIEKWPFAIILIENLQPQTMPYMQWLKLLVLHGKTNDRTGKTYSFQQAIIIITTTMGTDKMQALTPAANMNETSQTVDLMQLVLNETPAHPTTTQSFSHLAPQEISEDITSYLTQYFPNDIMREIHLIPFMILDYQSVEKILRLKLSAVGKQLQNKFNVELSYTPEIVRFLVQEILWRKKTKSMKQLLEQHLYSVVAQEILLHIDDKNRPKQYVLQLNASGQMMKCAGVH